MSIWQRPFTLEEVNQMGKGTMVEHIGIRITEITEKSLKAEMPVDHRTKQPIGLLHGGASVALAETIASTAANLVVNTAEEYCVGLEINANHISSCRDGMVVGEATPIHLGKTTQVWETKIHQDNRLVCVSRMTIAVMKRKN